MRMVLTRRAGAALGALAVATAALGTGVATAKPNGKTSKNATLQVCALLPDTTTSTRYTLFDAPYLTAAFKAAGVNAQVLNAQGSSSRQKSQAEGCLAKGAKVLVLDPFTTAAGLAITAEAVSRGAKVIDYDRLVPGSKVSYYVSFDNVRVGQLMADGLIAALKAKGKYGSHPVIAELNGGITDNNGHLFKQGYDGVLSKLYKNGTFKHAQAGDQWTDWDAKKGRTIFDQMLARNGNKIDGVIAANDGLAGAVIASLKAHGLDPLPLTGQDATPTGVQFILAGWQSGTVYKAIKPEANAAAAAAIAIAKGQTVKTNGKVSGVPSILLKPIWLTKSNYQLVFKDGFLKKNQVCTGEYAKYCK
jgi:D-xylose transport system substrate-binding protein